MYVIYKVIEIISCKIFIRFTYFSAKLVNSTVLVIFTGGEIACHVSVARMMFHTMQKKRKKEKTDNNIS